jgi:hypothetical protein
VAPWPNDDHLRVVFRRSCYGCRRGRGAWVGWHRAFGHRWEWEYRVAWHGVTLATRPNFATFERAHASMVRTVERLAAAGVIEAPERVS